MMIAGALGVGLTVLLATALVGLASLSQIDRSLDEASLMLRAGPEDKDS